MLLGLSGLVRANCFLGAHAARFASTKDVEEYVSKYYEELETLTQTFNKAASQLRALHSVEPCTVICSRMDPTTAKVWEVTAQVLRIEKEAELNSALASLSKLNTGLNATTTMFSLYNNIDTNSAE